MAHNSAVYLDSLKTLLKNVGESVLEFYYKSNQFAVRSKTDASPLTQADLLAHEQIVAGLQQITPNIPILSEEAAEIPFSIRNSWEKYWLVDPVDGTKEFIGHTGDFSINIALIENHKPILGAIYAPVLDKLFFAIQNQGAFKQEANDLVEKIQTRKLSEKLIVTVGHYYKIEKFKNVLTNLGNFEILPIGSALKFCAIAEGKADLYPRLGETYEWDTAAGQIILEEAGGAVVNFDFNPLQYNAKKSLVNPPFLAVGDKKILTLLRKNLLY